MIAIGCDNGGFEIKNAVMDYLRERGIEYTDFGSYTPDSVDYPIYAYKVATEVASGKYEFGILCCGTGIGIGMAANKVKGIRAATVTNEFSAEMTRRHNNANILCMGGRVNTPEEAVKFTDIFLNTPFSAHEERHPRRVNMITQIENGEFDPENL